MKTKRLKGWVIPGIYCFVVLLTVACIYFTIVSINNYFNDKRDFDYSINGINNSEHIVSTSKIKTVLSDNVAIKPYVSDKVTIGRNYYDINDSDKEQEKAIIFFENTYMQNTGIDYVSEEVFDVVSILPGKVIEILSDDNLGNILKIEHEDNIVSIYECIDNIKVKVGDDVTSGQVIASSGSSIINKDFNTSLHFEIYQNDNVINPNNIYSTSFNN